METSFKEKNMPNVRKPVVAGRFYAGNKDSLSNQIENCFKDSHGPGKIPDMKEEDNKIAGLVSPHAGYPYSGPVAAHGYYELAQNKKPDTVIIIGPNHSGIGPGVSVSSSDRWKTPFGEVEIDKQVRTNIVDNTELAELDESAHSREHSIEVQLPFLQYLFENDLTIVPICMKNQNLETSKKVGQSIGESINKNTLIIASTDLTHYEDQKTAEEKDKKAIEKMKKLDWKGINKLASEKNMSVCGYGPVSAAILASEKIGSERGKLFKYATSGDTAGPSNEVVGYCSLGFLR